MGNYVLALMLIVGWIIGVTWFGADAAIHLLLFVAMISVAGGQNRQRKLQRAARS